MTERMTPDKARALLDGTTPAEDWWHSVKGGWVRHLEPVGIDAAGELDVLEDDAALIVAAPTLAATIAGMREEYAVQVLRSGEWQYSRDEDDFRWQDLAVQMVRTDRDHPGEETRIVRRYVTEPEAVE